MQGSKVSGLSGLGFVPDVSGTPYFRIPIFSVLYDWCRFAQSW